MAASPFEILQRQAQHQVRSQLQKETARVRRELSLVGQVRQMYTGAGRALDQAAGALRPRRRPGRRAGALEEADTPAQPPVYADGYQRRSPVQPYRCPAEYRRARRVRLALGAAALVLGAALAWMAWQTGLLPF